jgi:integrase
MECTTEAAGECPQARCSRPAATGGSPGREAAYIIQRIAGQANANRPQQEHIQVSPHVLRHTFLRKLAEEKGVHHAREASGHQSDCYVRAI